jgi:mannose-6-phosphate isomerase
LSTWGVVRGIPPSGMADLYPLLMTPLFDPRPWGRFDLSPIYSRRFDEKIGESWLTGDNGRVQNGPLAGKSLAELSSRFGRELVGEAPKDGGRFPLLMKFLFPQEKLSVQVHPDDAAAREIGEPCGKTECWYVAHADSDAEIGLGLKHGVTRADFERSIHENRAEELLNWIKVHAGDMIYVAGGTVHTLGPGSIIVETQQQSDTTFRLYDYGRPRELHLERGMHVIKERAPSGKVRPQAFSNLDRNGNRLRQLVASEYFAVQAFELSSKQEFHELPGRSSAQILVAIEGAGALCTHGSEPVEFTKGDAVVVPAAIREFSVESRPRLQFLKSYVPGVPVSSPETSIE